MPNSNAARKFEIDIVICAYNERDYLLDCIKCIRNSARSAPHVLTRIIVVDNGSTDGTDTVINGNVILVRENNKGLPFAREASIPYLQSQFVAFVDADTRMGENWIATAVELISKNQHAVAISGPYFFFDLSRARRFIVEGIWGFASKITAFVGGNVINGGNFIVRRQALLDIGGFNTSIDFYGEDTDLAQRLSRVGKIQYERTLKLATSGRRFHGNGVFRTLATYAVNYLWIIFAKRPFTARSEDFR